MKFLYSILPLLACTAMAIPLKARSAAPITNEAVSLIESLEGWRANYYYINGHKTIGYGHDCDAKKDCSSIHAPLSKADGTALLKKDLAGYESCVCAMSNAAELNANQYGALVSFAYNSGCEGVQSWWHGAMAKKDFQGICKALPNTNTLGGQLDSRRAKEGHLCTQPTTAKSGC